MLTRCPVSSSLLTSREPMNPLPPRTAMSIIDLHAVQVAPCGILGELPEIDQLRCKNATDPVDQAVLDS